MLSPEDLEEFSAQFDADYAQFKKVSREMGPDTWRTMMSTISQRSSDLYEQFKHCAELKQEYGNDVPLVMASALASNLSGMCLNTLVDLAEQRVPPPICQGALTAIIYRTAVAPLFMILWERYQEELITRSLEED